MDRLPVRYPLELRQHMGAPAASEELVAAELNRNAAGPVATLHYGDLQLTGCDYHPSLADHRAVADLVAGAIGRIEGLWGAR